MPNNDTATSKRSWSEAFTALLQPSVIRMLFLGFSAGLPILLIFSTLSVWLREAGVERSAVTFFSWAALGYSFKFVWAPLIDRMPVPYLTALMGRRRAWLLTSQIMVIGAMLWTSSFDPVVNLAMVAVGAVLIGFTSATQDVVIDAYRIEAAPPDLQSMMAAMYIGGYRVGMVVAGAGSLWMAGIWEPEGTYVFQAWSNVYKIMAAFMLIGIGTTLLSPEPDVPERKESAIRSTSDYLRFILAFALAVGAFAVTFAGTGTFISEAVAATGMSGEIGGFIAEVIHFATSVAVAVAVGYGLVKARLAKADHLRESYVEPFTDFAGRYGKAALLILVLIGTYKISDIVMGTIANVFYIDLGFSKADIATYSKLWGLIATIAGGFLGGVVTLRLGVMKALIVGAVASGGTNVLFAVLAVVGPSEMFLFFAIAADNLAQGLAAAAFIAYLSSLTNVSFTAVQYAIFSSLMTLVPKVMAGYSGTMVDAIGYVNFFIFTAVLTLPVLALIHFTDRAMRRERNGVETAKTAPATAQE